EGRRAGGAQGTGPGGRDEVTRPKRAYPIAAGAAVVAVAAAMMLLRGVSATPKTVPTTHVQRGRVQVTVYTVGDLRASRSMQLAVPPMGGQLQIVRLAETGDAVKANDVVVEFDASDQEFALEQARFDLE